MKKSFFIGLSMLLVATIGAFASASSFRVVTAHYIDPISLNCVDTEINFECVQTPVEDCKELVESGTIEQLFAQKLPVSGQPGRFTCSLPYERP